MKKLLLLFILFSNGLLVNAQIGGGWDWAFNTGSLGGAEMKHMKYTADGSEILFGGSALAAAYFGSTTLTAPPPLANRPGQIKFFGKINAATGVPTIIRSFSNLPVTFDCITTDDAGNFYTGGYISSTTPVDLGNGVSVEGGFRQVVIIKFSANGSTIWAKVVQFGGTGAAANNINLLAVAPSGNVFFRGVSGNVDANNKINRPLYKLDSNGNVLWVKNALNGINAGSANYEPVFADKFIDNNENVHLFLFSTSPYSFDGVTYSGFDPTYGGNLFISLNSAGTVTKAQVCKGGAKNFQVNRTTGNLIFKWEQSFLNAAPFNNLPHPLASLNVFYANAFNGMVETDKDFNFVKAKDYSSLIDNPFQLTYTDDLFLALPNGKLIIQTQFQKTVGYFAGVDYAYAADPAKNAMALVETDANWNIAKFISGGKTTLLTKQYIAAFNSTYCMSAGFSNFDVFNQSLPGTLPNTSYGTVNLTGFNAASDFTTAYSAVVTSTSERSDIAIVQTKSENFPPIGSTTWLGTTNNWNTASNWSNGVPSNTMKAVFGQSTSNYPTVSTAPTAASLEVNSGVSLTLPSTLALSGAIKNNGTIILNNAGFFQGFGVKEWKGSGTVNFTGTAASLFFANFENALILNTNLTTFYDLKAPTVSLINAKINLNNKKLSITDSSPMAIMGASATNYIYGGTLERNINSTGVYEFPMGDFSKMQSVIITANNLVGTNRIAATYTNGAITGTAPNTAYNGVAITNALNGGWFSISPNQQPTAGNYDAILKIQSSTNTSATVGNYTVIKRDNSTSAWTVSGNYTLASVATGIVTARNNGLTSFSDFAIGIASAELTLANLEFSRNKLLVFPNPVSNEMNLTFGNELDNANITVLSMVGQAVYQKSNISGNTASFNVSDLPKGVYIIQVVEGTSVSNSKFIKQ